MVVGLHESLVLYLLCVPDQLLNKFFIKNLITQTFAHIVMALPKPYETLV
jgi:hypothetical protein